MRKTIHRALGVASIDTDALDAIHMAGHFSPDDLLFIAKKATQAKQDAMLFDGQQVPFKDKGVPTDKDDPCTHTWRQRERLEIRRHA